MLLATRPSVPIAVAIAGKPQAWTYAEAGQPIAEVNVQVVCIDARRSHTLPLQDNHAEQNVDIGSWGGNTKGAGRKAELHPSDRQKIASDYGPQGKRVGI